MTNECCSAQDEGAVFKAELLEIGAAVSVSADASWPGLWLYKRPVSSQPRSVLMRNCLSLPTVRAKYAVVTAVCIRALWCESLPLEGPDGPVPRNTARETQLVL